jgi:hypothetical protein
VGRCTMLMFLKMGKRLADGFFNRDLVGCFSLLSRAFGTIGGLGGVEVLVDNAGAFLGVAGFAVSLERRFVETSSVPEAIGTDA